MKRKLIFRSIFLIVVSLALFSCSASTVEIGMVETHLGGEWQASYQTFTGRKVEAIQADAGDILQLGYEVQVEKGSLALRLRSPADELIWSETFQADQSDAMEVSLEESGRYSLVVEGEDSGGSWELSVDVQ